MSISGIQSNINFTYDEVVKFLEGIGPDVKEDIMVKLFIQRLEKNESVQMDELLKIIHSSQTITFTFEKLLLSIVEHFIGFNEYNIIKKRIKYYNNLDTKVITQLPTESCVERVERLFTKAPPTYYTEYRSIYSNQKSILANYIYEVRRGFGYCKRVDRESSSKMFLLPQSQSSCKRLSHKSATVTPQTSTFRSVTASSTIVKPVFSQKIYPLPSDESPF